MSVPKLEEVERLFKLCIQHNVLQFKAGGLEFAFHPIAFEAARGGLSLPEIERPGEPDAPRPKSGKDAAIQAIDALRVMTGAG